MGELVAVRGSRILWKKWFTFPFVLLRPSAAFVRQAAQEELVEAPVRLWGARSTQRILNSILYIYIE